MDAGRGGLVVWTDYLCPWCHLGTRRVRRIEEEFGDAVRVEWRAFLLRPAPEPGRTLERFRDYTRSWLRPAGEPDAPEFRTWASDEGPPSHSIPRTSSRRPLPASGATHSARCTTACCAPTSSRAATSRTGTRCAPFGATSASTSRHSASATTRR